MESLGTSLSMDKWHIYYIYIVFGKLNYYILPIISYNHPKNTAVQQKFMNEESADDDNNMMIRHTHYLGDRMVSKTTLL